jgi:hypothetical protein
VRNERREIIVIGIRKPQGWGPQELDTASGKKWSALWQLLWGSSDWILLSRTLQWKNKLEPTTEKRWWHGFKVTMPDYKSPPHPLHLYAGPLQEYRAREKEDRTKIKTRRKERGTQLSFAERGGHGPPGPPALSLVSNSPISGASLLRQSFLDAITFFPPS